MGRTRAVAGNGKSSLVLIVEDDVSIANALRSILTRKGCDVIHAHSLRDGLAALTREPRHVILDLMLPDGEGIDLLRRVRESESAARVVVTTAVNEPDHLRDVQALRPHRILRKPLDLVDLLDAIGMM